jgi:serine/threonine protein kinase
MAKKLRVGDTVRGYRVTKVLGPGMMAIAYAAKTAAGAKIFLKQYKSPSPAVVWYPQFVEYQQELSRRVDSGKAARYAIRLIDAFEETWGGRTYFAAYEFVDNGRGLDHMLEEQHEIHRRTRVAPTSDPAVWARHVTWAKVLMAAVAALHESRVVHADLKPGNALLVADPSLDAGYQLKLIDTDFSLLADRKAPWHGYQGYIGTDNYRSPEHMARGAVPVMASDIFTCGLILYELLVGVHPYWDDDQAEYARRARAHAIAPPALQGVMPGPATNAEVSATLHRCLSPDPAARPTAQDVRSVLSGRGPRDAAAAAGRALTAQSIRLVAGSGESLDIRIRTELGKAVLRRFGADAEFWDATQCTIERRADGQWTVIPVPGSVNETLVNGTAVTAPTALREGDVLAVGRSAKGVSKLPLTARAG